MSKKHKDIMLTGGEPFASQLYPHYKQLALKYFKGVHLTTSNLHCLQYDEMNYFKSITISLHNRRPLKVYAQTVVYASIMSWEYFMELPRMLQKLGYAGLSINEEQRNGGEFNALMPDIEGFSIKINRRGHCMDSTIILPNLEVINDFTPYL